MVLRFVIVCLAAYRVTRLVVTDDFPPLIAFRRWLVARTGADSSWVDLISCPWCVGFWISCVTVLIAYPSAGIVNLGLRAWAVSTIVGVLAMVVERL